MVDKGALARLYSYDNEEFIQAAYSIILHRDADQVGMNSFLKLLQSGTSKEMIVYSILTSEECFAKKVIVDGFRIGKIPIEYLLGISETEEFIKSVYIAVLGRSADASGMKTYEDVLYNGSMDRLDVIIDINGSIEGRSVGTVIVGLEKISKIRRMRNRVYHIPVIGGLVRKVRSFSYSKHLSERRMEGMKHKMEALASRLEVIERSFDCMRIEESLNDSNKRIDEITQMIALNGIMKQSVFTPGIAYKEYEDEMRGSRGEIIERLRIYSSVIEKVKHNNGERINALDLGCGRGEWIELVNKEYEVYAIGVDSDISMLEESRLNNLNVVKADLVEYIKNASSNSVDIISMFQVAEHLPIEILNEVIVECSRVLRKGGALIIETPNPENLIVGACNFYFDPTHITKLPPSLLRILVMGAGLRNAEIVRMHEYRAIDVGNLADTDAIKQMAQFFNNYADYAVVAYKEETNL